MYTFIGVLLFYSQRWLVYPVEIVTELLKYIVRVCALFLFWYLVLEQSPRPESITDLVSYFLIASAVGMLTMVQDTHLGRTMRKSIKSGEFSNIVIKPTAIIPYYLARALGVRSVLFTILFIGGTIGVLLIDDLQLVNILFFLVMLSFSFILGFALNIFEAALTMYLTEITGIKNMVTHVIRLLSGALIPLTFFPEQIRSILELTPFPAMVFGPAQALLSSDPSQELAVIFRAGLFWSIALALLALFLWKKAIKHYESVGQ